MVHTVVGSASREPGLFCRSPERSRGGSRRVQPGGDARRSTSKHGAPLLASDAKPEAGAEIRRQRGISHHLVVMIVESVLNVGVCRNSRIDGVPAAKIDARVAGRVVDAEVLEIRIRAAAYETAS